MSNPLIIPLIFLLFLIEALILQLDWMIISAGIFYALASCIMWFYTLPAIYKGLEGINPSDLLLDTVVSISAGTVVAHIFHTFNYEIVSYIAIINIAIIVSLFVRSFFNEN